MPELYRKAAKVAFAGLALLLVIAPKALTQELPTALRDEKFKAGEALVLEAVMDSNSALNGGYPIDSAGYVDLPVAGRVQVAGRMREEVEAALAKKLANYLRDINLSVKPAIRLTLLGHWTRPGQYYVSPEATLFEAVKPAGGIAGEQKLEHIRVQRGTFNTDINFLDHYSSGVSLAKAGIKSGDLVVIPVPRPDEGFWYWFRESLSVTAQIATITGSVLTLYITYLLLEDRDLRSVNTVTP